MVTTVVEAGATEQRFMGLCHMAGTSFEIFISVCAV